MRWRRVPEVFPFGWVDAGSLLRPRAPICAFFATHVSQANLARRRPISLWVGARGSFRLFWNGSERAADAAYRGHDFDRRATSVWLEPGENRVVVKVCGDDAAPMLSLRLADPSGAPDTALVARAWTDPAYKARMLENGSRAAEELGFEVPGLKLIVVENKPGAHNVIVCTLCSCYPRMLLGIPPEWYKSRPYRSRVVREPRKVLAEFGLNVPPKTAIRVHDSNADMRYMVLPMRPAGTEGWSEARLAELVTRDCLIGVAVPKLPKKPKARKS